MALIVGVFVISLAAMPRAASAEQIDFRGTGFGSDVWITGPVSGHFFAGELKWAWVNGVPQGFDPTFFTYCVDIFRPLYDPQYVNIGTTDQISGPEISTNGGAKAAWLALTNAAAVHAAGVGLHAAALQVAIWEALYDPSADLAGGSFRLSSSTNTAIRDQANVYLGELYSGQQPYLTSEAVWLSTKIGQGQMIAVVPVPEPATLMLLMLGTAFVAGGCRRR
jgi:hypothetical protein